MIYLIILFVIISHHKIESKNEIANVALDLVELITDKEIKAKEPYSSLLNQNAYVNSLVVDRTEFDKIIKDETKELKKGTIFFDAVSQTNSSNLNSEAQGDKNIYETLKDSLRKLDEGNNKMRIRVKRNSSAILSTYEENKKKALIGKRNVNFNYNEINANDDLNIKETLNNSRRIYHGTIATIEKHAYMASVHLMGRFVCGGVVWSPDLVITSATCLHLLYNNRWYRETPNVLTVRVGSNFPGSGGELIPGLQVYFHPNFDYQTLAFNVAVIRLEYVMNLKMENGPRPINISNSLKDVAVGRDVTILGWGMSRRPKYIFYEQQVLRNSLIPVISKRDCWYYYGEDHLGYSTFCGSTHGRGSGACGRDRGGPAILDGLLVGIVSNGPTKCGDMSWPTVFAHIGRVSDWIKKIASSVKQKDRKVVDLGETFVDVDAWVDDNYDPEADPGNYTKST